jgi:hypothetical protein
MSNRKPFAEKASFYFSIFMIAVYVFTGLMLIFVLNFLQIQPANRIAAGSVLIVYACYRTFKLFRRKSLSTTDSNESS